MDEKNENSVSFAFSYFSVADEINNQDRIRRTPDFSASLIKYLITLIH